MVRVEKMFPDKFLFVGKTYTGRNRSLLTYKKALLLVFFIHYWSHIKHILYRFGVYKAQRDAIHVSNFRGLLTISRGYPDRETFQGKGSQSCCWTDPYMNKKAKRKMLLFIWWILVILLCRTSWNRSQLESNMSVFMAAWTEKLNSCKAYSTSWNICPDLLLVT